MQPGFRPRPRLFGPKREETRGQRRPGSTGRKTFSSFCLCLRQTPFFPLTSFGLGQRTSISDSSFLSLHIKKLCEVKDLIVKTVLAYKKGNNQENIHLKSYFNNLDCGFLTFLFTESYTSLLVKPTILAQSLD